MRAFIFITEWTHQWLDYVTRTTGRLTKTIRIMDISNVTMKRNFNMKLSRREANIVNDMEDCYPQMLQKIFFIDPPTWVMGIWKIIKSLMPKRVIEKVDFINPKNVSKDLDKLTKYI